MNAQLDLALEPRRLARTSDPATSHQAATRVSEFSRGHCGAILFALREHGAMTVDEIAAAARLQSQQVNKRTADLFDRGVIRPTGYERRSASGRMERVWEIV